MKKLMVLMLIFAIVGLAFVSCVSESVTYCPFCGKSNIKEESKYDPNTGMTNISYKCQNSDCGKRFGAGLL